MKALTSFVGRCVLLGDIPCSILSDILCHRERFEKMLCACGKFGVSSLGVWPPGDTSTGCLECRENEQSPAMGSKMYELVTGAM